MMKRFTALMAVAALGGATVAFAQQTNEPVPQPQPGSQSQSNSTPPPPPPNSVTTMQQPISGNSGATSPNNSMAPNAATNKTRMAAILPQGMSTQEACNGFKTHADCTAAAHAAHDLNIPFETLKSKVTGGQPLETAIHELKPDADAMAAARKAERQARSDDQAPPEG